MKKITPNTILKQGYKTFTPENASGDVFWWDYSLFRSAIVAQSSPILQGIQVISLDSYLERLAKDANGYLPYARDTKGMAFNEGFIEGYKSNPAKWTDEDMERAIEMARRYPKDVAGFADEEIMEQLSEISEIEVDNDFNVITIK